MQVWWNGIHRVFKRLVDKQKRFCSYECSHKATKKTKRPDKEILAQEIQQYKNWSALGRKYGVSDNAVRKWARQYGLL
jgi:transposase-like protein